MGHSTHLISVQMMIWLAILQTCFFVLMSPPLEDFLFSNHFDTCPDHPRLMIRMMYLYMQYVTQSLIVPSFGDSIHKQDSMFYLVAFSCLFVLKEAASRRYVDWAVAW